MVEVELKLFGFATNVSGHGIVEPFFIVRAFLEIAEKNNWVSAESISAEEKAKATDKEDTSADEHDWVRISVVDRSEHPTVSGDGEDSEDVEAGIKSVHVNLLCLFDTRTVRRQKLLAFGVWDPRCRM